MKSQLVPIFSIIALIALLFAVTIDKTEARPTSDDLSNMVEALRVLEQVDKVYSQLARPRFGRSLPTTNGEELRRPPDEMPMSESHK